MQYIFISFLKISHTTAALSDSDLSKATQFVFIAKQLFEAWFTCPSPEPDIIPGGQPEFGLWFSNKGYYH